MKQRITVDQWNELNDEQKKRLKEWWEPQLYDVFYDVLGYPNVISRKYYTPPSDAIPLLSIGQMVEFMQSLNKDWCIRGDSWNEPDICNKMWDVIKHYL